MRAELPLQSKSTAIGAALPAEPPWEFCVSRRCDLLTTTADNNVWLAGT